VLAAKREMFKSGEGFDWATGEALAFGSCHRRLSVRLSGQDCGRGTFSQRHAVWVDQNDEHKYVPLTTVPRHFEVHDSTLSEYGVLGFDMAMPAPIPRRWCCGKRSSAISPTARRSSSTSTSPRRKQVAARQRPRDAAAPWL
jgi:hypothetical protein